MTIEHQPSPLETDDRVALLRQTLTGAVPDAAQVDLAQLEAYAAAQLRGEAAARLYPQVAQQLDASVELAAIYNRLSDLLAADAADALPQPAVMPQPDLSFLRRAPTVAEQVAQALARVGKTLRVVFSAELLPQLTPPPALAGVRSAQARGETLFLLSPDQLPAGTEPFTISAYRDSADADQCVVEITVEPLDREFPDFGGIPVSLEAGDVTAAAETDSWGTVTFERVPVAKLGALVVDIDLGAGATRSA